MSTEQSNIENAVSNNDITLKQNLAKLKAKDFITARELLTTPLPEQSWLIDGLLSDEGMDMLVGRAKEFKSFTALLMACSCAIGRPFLSRKTKKCKALFIDEENAERRMAKRLEKLITGMQFNASELEDIYNNLTFVEMKGIILTAPGCKERLEEIIQKVKPGLVIIDSLVRVMQGNENSAEDTRKVFHIAKELFSKYNCCFLFLHHTVKGIDSVRPQDARGSGDFQAMVGTMLILSKIEDADGVAEYKLEVGLQRDNNGINEGIRFMVRDDLIGNKLGVVIELIETYRPTQVPAKPIKVHEELESRILEWREANKKDEFTTEDVALAFPTPQYSKSAREKALTELCNKNKIKRTTRGHYKKHPFLPFVS